MFDSERFLQHQREQASEQASATNPPRSGSVHTPYDAAKVSRLNYHWMPRNYSGDAAIGDSWDLMHARIRDRVRNDPVLSKCQSTLKRLIVGDGIQCFSDAAELEEDNEDLVRFEVESDTWFERWAENEADSEGDHSFFEMQQIAICEEMESGNVLWLQVMDNAPGRTIPLCYQLVEWDQMDMTKDRPAELSRSRRGRRYNRISNGIEYDSRNRKVAFHIYDAHPYDSTTSWTAQSTRVPASRVFHQYSSPRPSARMGVSWFAPNLRNNHDLDRYVANEITTRAIAALMGVTIKSSDSNASDGFDATDPDTGLSNIRMGYPHYMRIHQDEEVNVIESKRGGTDAESIVNLLLTLQAMGVSISVNRLLGDPTRANLASIKASHQDDAATVSPIQGNMARKVVIPIRKAHTAQGFGMGLFKSFTARDYQRQPWRLNAFSAIAGNHAYLDKDDGEASMDLMRSGLAPYQDECARRGRHWRRNIRRMAVVNRYAAEQGVVLDWTKGQGSAPDATTSIAGDEQPAGETDGR